MTTTQVNYKTVRYNDQEFKAGTARLLETRKNLSVSYEVVADLHNGKVLVVEFIGEVVAIEAAGENLATALAAHAETRQEGRTLVRLLNS